MDEVDLPRVLTGLVPVAGVMPHIRVLLPPSSLVNPPDTVWGTSGGFRALLCHITGWSQANAPLSSYVKWTLRYKVLWETSCWSIYTAVHRALFCTKPLKSCQKSRFISPSWGYLILIPLTLIFMYNYWGEKTTKTFCIREQIRHKFILEPSKMLISMFFSLPQLHELAEKLVLLGFGFLKGEMIAGEIPWVTHPCLMVWDGIKLRYPGQWKDLDLEQERFFSQQFIQKSDLWMKCNLLLQLKPSAHCFQPQPARVYKIKKEVLSVIMEPNLTLSLRLCWGCTQAQAGWKQSTSGHSTSPILSFALNNGWKPTLVKSLFCKVGMNSAVKRLENQISA